MVASEDDDDDDDDDGDELDERPNKTIPVPKIIIFYLIRKLFPYP